MLLTYFLIILSFLEIVISSRAKNGGNCLNNCLKLCSDYNGNFVLAEAELNRTFQDGDSNWRPSDSGDGNSESGGEKSVFELEFSPINKRENIFFVTLPTIFSILVSQLEKFVKIVEYFRHVENRRILTNHFCYNFIKNYTVTIALVNFT